MENTQLGGIPTTLRSELDRAKDRLVALRRDVHQHPETGFLEKRTQQVIREYLLSIGVEPENIKECAGTGLVVDLKGQSDVPAAEGAVKMVALRSDIDALPMTERNPLLPYRSKNEGVAHMCGHDGHIACLLGGATLIQKQRHLIPKTQTVRLLFQPAEEGPQGGGAIIMIKDGCLEGVDEVYGMHNWPLTPVGVLCVKAGPLMAHVSDFTVTIKGRGSHSSQPHTAVDPIVTAAQIVTSLQTIVSRNTSYEDLLVLSVCFIKGGEAYNVLPDTATFGGTIRDLSKVVFDKTKTRFNEIVENTCKAMNCTCEIEWGSGYPVLINTPLETEHVIRLAKEQLGAENVSSAKLPILASEDFAYYLEQKPGCFFFLGIQKDDKGKSVCHCSDYDFNDDVIPIASEFWIRLVADRLKITLQ